MPTISTGNPGWDQNLSTLGNALFPDPSKVGQGYYYGSEARAKQLESNKIIDQQNWRNRYGMMTQGGAQPAPPVYQAMDNVAGAAPILAPPTNLPYSAAAAAAPVPAGAHNLAATAANMSPPQAATALSSIIPPFTTGQAQEFGAPTPGAPVAPQTTTSNGQAPANDQGSGPLHPGSITPSDGGLKQSGPAAHNGSPAPMPPGMTLPGLMAMSAAGSLGGLDAASVAHGGAALAYELYSRGTISRDQYHQMLGATGSPTLATADTAAAASVPGAEIGAGATIGAARIADTGQTTRKGMELQTVVTEPTTGASKLVPLSQMQGLGGTPTFAPEAVTTGIKPVEVQPGGPGTQPTLMATGEAIKGKVPTYQKGTEDIRQTQEGKIDTYINPNNPLEEKPMTARDAVKYGWVEKPKSENEMRGILDKAIARETDPEKLQELQNKRNMIATAGKAATPEEQVQNQWITDTQFQKQFAVPGGYTGYGAGTNVVGVNTNPAATSPELGVTYADLTEQYFQRGPAGVRGNRVTASNEALKQLIEQRYVDPNQDRSQGMSSTSINANTYDKNGNITGQAPHFRVDIKDPDSKKVYPAGAPPKVMMRLSSAIPAPAGGPAPAAPRPPGPTPILAPSAPPPVLGRSGAGGTNSPPGSLGPSPPGVPEGGTVYAAGGKPAGVNRGGFVYPQ